MFEQFYAKSQTFRDNMRFLSHFRLEALFRSLRDFTTEEEKKLADTIQNESDALTAEETTVAAVVQDVAAEITKFQAAQAAGQDTTPFVTRINAINTTLQQVDQSALTAAGSLPVTLPPASPVAPVASS